MTVLRVLLVGFRSSCRSREEEERGGGPAEQERPEGVSKGFLQKMVKTVKTVKTRSPYKTPPLNTRRSQKEDFRRF